MSRLIAECSELNNTASFPVLVRTPQNVSRTVPTSYGTIAAAMAAAADGDTIRILTGNYDEDVAVTKDLVFVGSGPDSTVLRTSTNDDAIMDIAGGHSVTVRGIRFESQLSEPFSVARGIRDTAGTVAVTHCRFHTIPNWSLQVMHGTVSVDSCEFLMFAGAADVGVDAFHSVFWISDSYGGTRLDHVFDPWGTALGVVEDCTMDGSSVHWANGIRLRGSGPVALLRNNLIVGQHLGTEPWIQTVGGIAAFGPMFVEIYDNEIHGFTHGLNIGTDATARVHRNTITDNLLVGVECFNNPLLDLGGGDLGSPGLNLIQNNGTFSVRNKSAPDLYAKYNYWGGGDSATIDATMYDDEENLAYGEVLFKPGGFILQAGKLVQLITELQFILTFDSVIGMGVLSVVPLDAGPRPPGGVEPIPPVPPYLYDVVTDAVFMDDIEVCYEYDEALLTGSELATTMWHHDGSIWFNITSSRTPAEDMVCGTTRGLSVFMVGLMDFLCGDTDASGSVTSADIINMVNHVFKGSDPPVPVPAAGDANSDHVLTSADIIYLVNFVFKGGPAPECR